VVEKDLDRLVAVGLIKQVDGGFVPARSLPDALK
jgi:hypothetical protein